MIASKIRTQENLKETKQNLTLTKKKKKHNNCKSKFNLQS